MAKGGIAVTDE